MVSTTLILSTLMLLAPFVDSRPTGGSSKKYPRCLKRHRTGYAHYDGWRLMGDDLSGAVPVSPEFACVNACNKYGSACGGIFFDASVSRCYLKGVRPNTWTFARGEEGDGTDLIGGCELWSGIVSPEMDAACCID